MSKNTKNQLEYLRGLGSALLQHNDSRIAPDAAVDLIRVFLREANYKLLGGHPNTLNTWYRCRVQHPNESIRDHLCELLYRLAPSDKPGRAHRPGERVFYAGWNPCTAFAEVEVQPPATTWLTHVRPKQNSKLIVSMIGAYESYFRSGRVHYPITAIQNHLKDFFRTATELEVVSAVYADHVLATLLRTSGESKYHLTSALFRIAHTNSHESMFLFPSVQVSSSMNMAVTAHAFNEFFEVMCVERNSIVLNMGSGLLLPDSHHRSYDFSPEGSINWYSPRKYLTASSYESGLQYSSDIQGWRVPSGWASRHAPAARLQA